ncbi:hypothetical protein LBMAG53_35910 [Planctomycetota bacterium]|nr:hypothetical protein LBMAG53_35910 [Planctomycetota bacterium]
MSRLTTGGEPDAKGNAYEADLVVHHLLRVIHGLAERVIWHDPEAGHGIDLIVVEPDAIIGIQAKSGTSSNWTPNALTKEGILVHARDWLARSDLHRFQLHAAHPAKELERISDQARIHDATRWWLGLDLEDRKMIASFAGKADSTAHADFVRIRVEIQNPNSLDATIRSQAALFQNPASLRAALTRLVWEFRERTWDAQSLKSALQAQGCSIEFAAWDQGWETRLLESRQRFLDGIAAQRGELPTLARSATEAVLQGIADLGATGGVVAVHGPGGVGKSEVLAATVQRLPAETIVMALAVVGLDAQRPWRDLGLGERPLAALARVAKGRAVVLVLDQLDQAVWAAPQRLRSIQDLLRQARDLRIVTVLGCRSVDLGDPKIAPWIAPRSDPGRPIPGPERCVLVEDLAVAELEQVLRDQQVPVADLHSSLLTLLRRPICLRLALHLHHRGGSSRLPGIRHLVDLLRNWSDWWHLQSSDQADAAQTALDEIARYCERHETVIAPIDTLTAILRAAVPVLVDLGVLVWHDAAQRQVRWSHQLLLDHNLAGQWLRLIDGGRRLAEMVGPRESQDQRTGNRLRLLVPGLVDRPRLRDQITPTFLAGLRPLARVGFYRGLAEIDDPDDLIKLRSLVFAALSDNEQWRMALRQVCPWPWWTAALEDWFKDVWGDPLRRGAAVDVLSSVVDRWGNGVARILTQWRKVDPEAITQVRTILFRAHDKPSDEMFTHWLDSLARTPNDRTFYIEWPIFLEKCPDRAARTLAVLLPYYRQDDLEEPDGYHQFPGESSTFSSLGRVVLEGLWQGWTVADFGSRPRWPVRLGLTPLWSRLVDLLAGALAIALERGEYTWKDVLDRLPNPLRWPDHALLLRAAARSRWTHVDQIDAALGWFTRTPAAWFQPAWDQPPWRESVPFIDALAKSGSNSAVDAVQRSLLSIPDPRGSSELRDHGATNWFLLNAIPVERQLPETQKRIASEIRFAGRDQTDFQLVQSGPGGWVGSDLAQDRLEAFTDDDWRDAFKHARDEPEAIGTQAGPDRIIRRSVETYASDLRRCAQAKPRRFLSLLRVLNDDDPPEMLRVVVCGMLSPPGDTAPELRLRDDEIVQVVSDVRVLDEAECRNQVGLAIRERAEISWPESVIAALCAWASDPLHVVPEDSTWANGERPRSRWNEESLVAIGALAALATEHPMLRERIWSAIRDLPANDRPDLIAACVMAAIRCRTTDPLIIDRAILTWTADHRVAGQDDVADMLRRLASIHPEAIARLLALANADAGWVQQQAGEYRVLLAMDGRMSLDDSVMTKSSAYRRGMAKSILAICRGSPAHWKMAQWPPWLLDRIILLADDADDDVARQMAMLFYSSREAVWDATQAAQRLMTDREFVVRFTRTRAVRLDAGPIIGACLASTDLRPWATVIRDIVGQAVHGQAWFDSRELVSLVGRLAEEAEAAGDRTVRLTALDAWDLLIDSGWRDAVERSMPA